MGYDEATRSRWLLLPIYVAYIEGYKRKEKQEKKLSEVKRSVKT